MSLINDTFNSGTPVKESEKIFVENRVKLLTQRVQKLNVLCSDLDPYKDIPAKFQVSLADFDIYETSDPFTVTNKLVILLEESIEELQKLEKSKSSLS